MRTAVAAVVHYEEGLLGVVAKTKLKSKSSPAALRNKTARRKKAPSAASKMQGTALERAVERFQGEPDTKKAHERWAQIERSVFGVEFED